MLGSTPEANTRPEQYYVHYDDSSRSRMGQDVRGEFSGKTIDPPPLPSAVRPGGCWSLTSPAEYGEDFRISF
ncbi:hypothetical protein BJX96DRAFT_155478 [Aspergillus floccosus]